MARPLRIEYPGAYYHVMNRGLARGDIFLNTDDRERFFTLLGETCQLWTVKICVFCLMDTHYHLLLQTPRAGLSRVMRHIDGIYTQRLYPPQPRSGGHCFHASIMSARRTPIDAVPTVILRLP